MYLLILFTYLVFDCVMQHELFVTEVWRTNHIISLINTTILFDDTNSSFKDKNTWQFKAFS